MSVGVGTSALFFVRAAVKSRVGARDFSSHHERLEDQLACCGNERCIALFRQCRHLYQAKESGNTPKAVDNGFGIHVIVYLKRSAPIEPHDDVVGVDAARASVERRVGCTTNELARDIVTPHELTFVLELDL